MSTEPNELPTIDEVTEAVRLHLVTTAMTMTKGNLTHAAGLLRTSRRTLRETLKKGGLYPWPGPMASVGIAWVAVTSRPRRILQGP